MLPNLRNVTLTTTRKSFVWSNEDELEFLEDVTRLVSSNLRMFVLDYPLCPRVHATWVRVGGLWTIRHREQQEDPIQRAMLEREAWRKKYIADLAGRLFIQVGCTILTSSI